MNQPNHLTQADLAKSPLRIGVSTRSLFSLEKEHRIFENEGVQAYAKFQLDNEDVALEAGAAQNVISRLLKLNEGEKRPIVEVILLSRNSPDLSLRAFNSIEKIGLDIRLGSFTSGRSVAPYVSAWNIDLFLSNDTDDVQAASSAGAAAASLGNAPEFQQDFSNEVRIAFDGDAVVFSPESDEIYKNRGLNYFLEHERKNARNPMSDGPFGNFLKKLSIIRAAHLDAVSGVSKVRIAIVTARNAPAHERVVHTLRAWGTPADEAHFVGPNEKGPILKAFSAHIFFDDQEKHVIGASKLVASGLVPGPHRPDEPVIPSA